MGACGGNNDTGPKSSAAVSGAGGNAGQDIGNGLSQVRVSWPSLHIRITMGLPRNKQRRKPKRLLLPKS